MAKTSKKTQEAIENENGNINPEAEQPIEEQAAQQEETAEEKSARLLREENLKTAKTYIGHKAMYVPAEDFEFYPAVVVGAVVDAKGTVLVALRTEDGKRVTKKFGSKLLRVLDEMAEKPVRKRAKAEKKPITDEDINLHREKVGLPVTLDEVEGRVRGVQVDKRTCQIYLTIHLADGSKRHTKITNENLHFGEADSETETIRANYFSVLEQRAQGSKSSPERQVQSFGAGFVKAYKQLIEAGKIEETENLIDCIEAVIEVAKSINMTQPTEQPEEQPAE